MLLGVTYVFIADILGSWLVDAPLAAPLMPIDIEENVTSRRSRSPRRKSSGLPVETPPSTTSFETRYPIPKAWSPDDIYLDRQQEYKLTFPRRVVATAWSRDLHIDHQPIEDVRLIDVLSRKQENWTLRLVANGRLVQYEGFRNRQEAYLWSSLSRKIFKSSDVDIARIIGHLHPASLKDDWDEKRVRNARSSRALMLTSPASSVTFILLPSRTTGMRNARAWIALLNASLTTSVIRCPRTLPKPFRTKWKN